MKNYNKSVTIKDVAKDAGVSLMSVNRFYRNPGRVTEKTRAKVFKSVQKLGYIPHYSAHALRSGKSKSVGILISDPKENFVARTLSVKLMNEGYFSYIVDSLGDKKIVESSLRDFLSRNVDAVVLDWSDFFFENPEIESLLKKIKNVILISNTDVKHLPFDICEFKVEDAIVKIIQTFKAAGRGKITFLGRSDFLFFDMIKRNLALHDCLHPDWYWDTIPYPSKPNWGDYLDTFNDLFDFDNPPDAIIVHNDLLAGRLIDLMIKKGIKVPDDIAVSGMGNSPWSALLPIPLTTIDYHIPKMAEYVSDILIKRLREEFASEQHQYRKIQAEFIKRDSA